MYGPKMALTGRKILRYWESDGLNRTFEHGTDLSLDNTREYGDKDHEMAF